jgi:Co/Zn/Cd efflux system component
MKTRQDKSQEVHGLFKVPDYVLLKESRIELGQANAYIEELEDVIKELQSQLKSVNNLTKEEIINIKRESLILQYSLEREKNVAQIHKLRTENSNLVGQLYQLKNILHNE